MLGFKLAIMLTLETTYTLEKSRRSGNKAAPFLCRTINSSILFYWTFISSRFDGPSCFPSHCTSSSKILKILAVIFKSKMVKSWCKFHKHQYVNIRLLLRELIRCSFNVALKKSQDASGVQETSKEQDVFPVPWTFSWFNSSLFFFVSFFTLWCPNGDKKLAVILKSNMADTWCKPCQYKHVKSF